MKLDFKDDKHGQDLQDAIAANEALLAGLRYDLGQRVVRAQGGEGEYPSAFELGALKKLELQISNDKMYLEARALTRTASA